MSKLINRVLSSIYQADKSSLIFKNNQDLPVSLIVPKLVNARVEISTQKIQVFGTFDGPDTTCNGRTLVVTVNQLSPVLKKVTIPLDDGISMTDCHLYPKEGTIWISSLQPVGSFLQIWNKNMALLAAFHLQQATPIPLPPIQADAQIEIV